MCLRSIYDQPGSPLYFPFHDHAPYFPEGRAAQLSIYSTFKNTHGQVVAVPHLSLTSLILDYFQRMIYLGRELYETDVKNNMKPFITQCHLLPTH